MSRIEPRNSNAATYQYWRHKITGAVYLVHLAGMRVAGFFGPLSGVPREPLSLPPERYDSDPDRCLWLEQRGGEFLLIG
jgi:hypothetical protein